MKKYITLLFAVLVAVTFFGCAEGQKNKDPSKAQLAKGTNIDLKGMTGMVVGKSTNYYEGDREETKTKAGDKYHCLRICYADEQNTYKIETFYGVPIDYAYNKVEVGTRLPIINEFTQSDLQTMCGEVVDMWYNPTRDQYIVSIRNLANYLQVGQVSQELYHNKLKIGIKLPLETEKEVQSPESLGDKESPNQGEKTNQQN